MVKSASVSVYRILILSGLMLAASAGRAETTVLRNFTLIDGASARPLANAAMIITDGRIQWTGPVASLKAPAGAQTVDLAGKYVMPGIINLHCHLGNTVELAQDPKNFTRANVQAQLAQYARYGVTTVLTMGSEQPLIVDLRAEQRRTNRPPVARIYAAVRGFTAVGGYPTTVPGMKGVPYEVGSVADVEKAVSELAAVKADLVKIWVDDHLGKDKKIPTELSKAIIANARKHNMKVGAHIFYLDDAKVLVEAGLYGVAHSIRDKPVDDALIALMKKRGAWLQAATLTREASTFVFAKPTSMLDDPFFKPAVSAATLATLKDPAFHKRASAEPDTGHGPEWLDMAKKNLKRMVDAGVKAGFGTDSGPPRRIPGYFEHLEMEMMADAGLTPQQILTMATRNSAEFLGAADLGTLQKGKWADLIVLRSNPLENIKNTRAIDAVYIAGAQVAPK
jgi:imidazolonepropionase-like amidohydrolase